MAIAPPKRKRRSDFLRRTQAAIIASLTCVFIILFYGNYIQCQILLPSLSSTNKAKPQTTFLLPPRDSLQDHPPPISSSFGNTDAPHELAPSLGNTDNRKNPSPGDTNQTDSNVALGRQSVVTNTNNHSFGITNLTSGLSVITGPAPAFSAEEVLAIRRAEWKLRSERRHEINGRSRRADRHRARFPTEELLETMDGGEDERKFLEEWKGKNGWPPTNEMSRQLAEENERTSFPADSFSSVIVLYIHNRTNYLNVVLASLSAVNGISESLLIVSHDGFYPEVDRIVKSINFCKVKQIYAVYSPHNFNGIFPGVSPADCVSNLAANACIGHPDHFGNFRTVSTVSLKHHWWWLQNTIWDHLPETKSFTGHILFIEEDHYIFPNALQNLASLVKLKQRLCPKCFMVNLAPTNVGSRGFGTHLVVERMGNVGYAFNRSVWELLHSRTREFCEFDEYNWDLNLWSMVQQNLSVPLFSLRGARGSAFHIGKCGLHMGKKRLNLCNRVTFIPPLDERDKKATSWVPTVKEMPVRKMARGYSGWGGWGDWRDRELCRYFSRMYRN